jgi:uncharacterized protein YgiM (DUF1202 family)
MKKSLIVLFAAILLASSATACSRGGTGSEESGTGTGTSTVNPFPSSSTVSGSDTTYEPVTSASQNTPASTTQASSISEPNATFTAISKQLYVFTAVATVRTDTVISDTTGCGWPSEGTVLEATGESTNWYRINYGGKTCYIAKSVVFDYSVIQAFTEVNETVTISDNVNVRSVPSSANSTSIRGVLKKGATVTRVGVSANWSCILYEVVSETETDASGAAKTEVKRYYISNDCIATSETSTQAPDTASTEAPAGSNA